jgi:Ni,Fe-hydrogenase I small subunit
MEHTRCVTAATQPSIEDLVLGALPWVPKIKFHNPFLAYENGDEFVKYFRHGAEGKLSPFILVVEGSIPNENNKQEGYWASFSTDKKTGQPITTCNWIDQLAQKAWAVVAAGTCATSSGISTRYDPGWTYSLHLEKLVRACPNSWSIYVRSANSCTPPLVPDRHLIFAMLLELVSSCRNRSKQ